MAHIAIEGEFKEFDCVENFGGHFFLCIYKAELM
jgi:hypothetical protein